MQTVDAEPRTDRVAAGKRPEGVDGGARRGVNVAWRVADRAHNIGEPRELLARNAEILRVGCRQVREDPLDLEVTELADRAVPRSGIGQWRAQAREAGIHLE